MKPKPIERFSLILVCGTITGLMIYALHDMTISSYLFLNKDPKIQEGFTVIFFIILLGVFARHTIINIINLIWGEKPDNITQKEESKI